jgi:uncharacterized membrane protein YphA (DoxX/SURF4 family)
MAALGRWVRFWDQRESQVSLCASRVLVGLALFGDLAYVELIGARSAAWAPPPVGLGWGALGAQPPLAARLFGADSETASLLFWIALVASLLFAIGALFRPSALVLVAALTERGHFAPDGDRGIDKLLRIVVVVLALSGASQRWSLDAWLARRLGRATREHAPAWPRYLLFAQLCWMYFSAAHNRGGRAWWPHGGFSALAQILGDPHVARFDPGLAKPLYPLLQLATASTMLFELCAPLLMLITFLDRRPGRGGRVGDWVRRFRVRWVWLAVGVCMHLGIALTMRLGVFPFGILALYPVLLHPEELERGREWAARWLRKGRATASLAESERHE